MNVTILLLHNLKFMCKRITKIANRSDSHIFEADKSKFHIKLANFDHKVITDPHILSEGYFPPEQCANHEVLKVTFTSRRAPERSEENELTVTFVLLTCGRHLSMAYPQRDPHDCEESPEGGSPFSQG
jgi:hypothetical protein